MKAYFISLNLWASQENFITFLKTIYQADFQRVVLNGQTSSWKPVLAGAPQGSILGPLLFLVYINDLPNGLKSNVKLFADDTSFFTVVKDKNESGNILNNDLQSISRWAYKWKMLFNPDPKKPAQEVLFSRKNQIQNHAIISLNNIQVERSSHQKHLGLILDKKVNFKEHVNTAISKVNKGISVLKKLRHTLPRKSLITIYKSFLRPLVDYGDIIYDQPNNESFCEKLESIQYKAVLAITGAIQGTSRDKIYAELGLESLKARRWYKRLSCMFKIMNKQAPNYLFNLIPKCNQIMRTRNNHKPVIHCRTDCFKYSFFPSTLRDWFSLDENIRNAESISSFKNRLLALIRPLQISVFNIFDPEGLIILTRLRLGFSHLNEHRFRHNIESCINPLCSCSLETEDISHYLLHCHHFIQHRLDLMNSVKSVISNFESFFDSDKVEVLLYGDSRLDNIKKNIYLRSNLKTLPQTPFMSRNLLYYCILSLLI